MVHVGAQWSHYFTGVHCSTFVHCFTGVHYVLQWVHCFNGCIFFTWVHYGQCGSYFQMGELYFTWMFQWLHCFTWVHGSTLVHISHGYIMAEYFTWAHFHIFKWLNFSHRHIVSNWCHFSGCMVSHGCIMFHIGTFSPVGMVGFSGCIMFYMVALCFTWVHNFPYGSSCFQMGVLGFTWVY